MCVFHFLYNFVRNISHSEKNSVEYFHKCTNVVIQSARNYSQISIKLELPRQIFEKYSNTKFHENPSNRSRVFHAGGQT